MKIVNINIENIKKIKVVDITPGKDGVVIIEGKNAQGKSSIMDSIGMLIGGQRWIPEDPVRHGEEKGIIKAELAEGTEGVIVRRTFKKDGSSALEIKTKDGEKVRSPQEWLNERLKEATLDPSVFIRLRPVERVEELKKIPGLDCTKEDAAYMVEYDKRTLVNRDLDTAKKSLTEYDGLVAPKELRTVAQIQAEIDKIEEKNKGIREANKVIDDKMAEFEKLKAEHERAEEKKAEKRQAWESALEDIEEAEGVIKEAEETIKKQKGRIEQFHTDIEANKKDYADLEKRAEKIINQAKTAKKEIELSMRVPELSAAKLKEELVAAAEVTGTNEKMARKSKLEASIKNYEEDVLDIETVMTEIKENKRAKLAAFKLPVEGLEVGERDIMFSGIAFDNLSQAQKISVSMALAIAQQPTLRIIKVAEGSLFDENTLKQVIDFAVANDFQVWIERVANTPSGNAIFIEDGEVIK
jgi:DNA repair exonuclease SbcCD ATPase subunit